MKKDILSLNDLANAVADKTKYSATVTKIFLEVLVDRITFYVAVDKKVRLNGIGTWSKVLSKKKNGINPRTKEALVHKAKNRVSFKRSDTFDKAVCKTKLLKK